MRAVTITIPQPCDQSWAAMTPTAAGRHCATCQTEVADFTRMTEAQVLAYLAARQGQRVCGRMAASAASPRHYKRKSGPKRWLLALVAFLGGQQVSALGLPPQLPPGAASFFRLAAPKKIIVIQGVVVDDTRNVPVQGVYVFINDTRYGAVTNEKGEFTLSFSADWAPARSGVVQLRIAGVPFELLEKTVEVRFKANSNPAPFITRLLSVPERGMVMGKPYHVEPPAAPPRKGRH